MGNLLEKWALNPKAFLVTLLVTSLLSLFILLNYAEHSALVHKLAQSQSVMASADGFLKELDGHDVAQTEHIKWNERENSGKSKSESQAGFHNLARTEHVRSIERQDSDKSKSESQSGFQRVGDALNTFVYSAIYDDIDVPIIRVIALVRYFRDTERLPTFRCTYFSTPGHTSPITYPGILQYIPEPKWGYSYHSGFIKCILPKDLRPTSVSISGNITASNNMLRVIYPLKKKRHVTRCFSALHSNFSNTLQLIQTLEISLMFGVEHFIVYNYSIHESAMNVLKHYRNLGVLDILPWDVPVNRSQIHYFAQLAVIHDCLYRNLHVSDYILTGDTDEVYIPKRGGSILQMINGILKGRPSCSGILVRNAFFPLNLQPHVGHFTLKQEARRHGITYLLYTKRLKINQPTDRSKLIIKPTGVEMSYIHTIERLRKGHTDCICPSSQCILHHYRVVPPRELGSLRQTDITLLNYSENIVKRVIERMDQLNLDKGASSLKV